MIFPGFPVLSSFQVFQVEWEPWNFFNSIIGLKKKTKATTTAQTRKNIAKYKVVKVSLGGSESK